jgi:hypothetical protein
MEDINLMNGRSLYTLISRLKTKIIWDHKKIFK